MIRLYFSIFLMIGFMFFTSCNKREDSISANQNLSLIETAKATRRNFIREITGYGYIKSLREENIVIYTQGIIKQIWAKDGEWVKKGQKILSIEGYYLVKAKESGVPYKSGTGNNNIVKVAPISGYVTALHKNVGNAVTSGEVVASVVDLKNILAEIEVFGDKAVLVKVGQTALVIHNRSKIIGKVVSVSSIVNPQTGGRTVGIRIVQPQSLKFLPGDFTKAEIIVEKHNGVVAVPQNAVLNDNGNKIVLVKSEKGYQKIDISTGLKDKGYIEVSGLKGNETVITTGAYEILNKNINEKIKIED